MSRKPTFAKRVSLDKVRAVLPTLEGLRPETEKALAWLEDQTEITGYDFPPALAVLLLALIGDKE